MRSKHELQAEIKKSSTGYLLWFLFGASYAYMGKWGKQILYWITFGGFGLWMVCEAVRLSGKIKKHNARIYEELDEIEKKEKREHLESLKALSK